MPDLGLQKGYEKNNHKIPTHWLGAVKQPAVPPELAKAYIKKEDAQTQVWRWVHRTTFSGDAGSMLCFTKFLGDSTGHGTHKACSCRRKD